MIKHEPLSILFVLLALLSILNIVKPITDYWSFFAIVVGYHDC